MAENGSILGGAGKGAGKALADRKERVSVSEAMDVFVVARKAAQYQPDVGAYKIPLDRKEPFRKTGEETLNVEISVQEAKEKAKGLALQELRSRYTLFHSLMLEPIRWKSPNWCMPLGGL